MRRLLLIVVAAGGAACFPSLDDRPWLVDEARILAVRGTPAEQRPNEAVAFEALVASPAGPIDVGFVRWAFCMQPRTVEERTGVTAACAQLTSEALLPTGSPATLPRDACARFGPNPPPSEGGGPPLRPTDPDRTGGYFMPVQASLAAGVTEGQPFSFGFQRVRCDLAGATRQIFDAFQARYTMNVNPAIEEVTLVIDGASLAVTPAPTVARGADVGLRVRWAADAAEPYVVYDAEESALFDHVEALTVSWYVSAGELESQRVEADEDALRGGQREAELTWTAPSEAGTAWLWTVLRDARGGMSWVEVQVLVQ